MRRLVRSRTDKKIAGICGGLGELFSVDPTLIRLAVVFIGLVTAILPMLLAYLVGWAIIPIAPPQDGEHKKSVPPGGAGLEGGGR
jgi:phage shock protein C